jgi:cytochrome c biogenesis protein CcmG, thiol:disulfide interchange protein DsbE
VRVSDAPEKVALASVSSVDSGGSVQDGVLDRPASRLAKQERRSKDRVFKWVAVVAAAGLVGFIVFVIVRGPSKPATSGTAALEVPPPPTLKPGTVAPTFSLPSLGAGDPVSLSAFRGSPVIVNFFASWCRDCRAELDAVATVAHHSAGRVAVVGVDSNESSDAAALRLLAAAHATYPVALDNSATVATQYLVNALPVSYFVNAEGRVVGAALGPQTVTSLDRWVERLEAER